MLIANARIVMPHEILDPGWVRVHGGTIEFVGEGQEPLPPTLDAEGRILLSGFIDLHIHGALGADVMDATPDALRTIARFCALNGVTRFLPTTLTASHENTLAALHTIRRVMDEGTGGAIIMGAHLEGPYINPNKAGAQDSGHIRLPNVDELRHYLDVGVIRLVSLAPEMPGADELIDLCVQNDVTVSIAHTDATYEQASAAIQRGIRHSTHTFNAMRGFHHRQPGTVGAVLNDRRVACEVIADNVHVHPAALRLLWQMKGDVQLNGDNRVILVTDAMRAAGMSDGVYLLGQQRVTVADGRATLADGTLAGSILTMPQALRTMQDATMAPLSALVASLTQVPARAIGAADCGAMGVGMAADFVLLNDDFSIWKTIINGVVWDSANRQEE